MNWVNKSSSVQSSAKSQVATKKEGVLEKNTKIEFTENSAKILEKRYLRKNPDGSAAETIEGMFERIANVVAEPDMAYRDVKTTEVEFYNLLSTKRFFPNSPTFTGAGTPLGQLAACFVLPIEDDMGKESDGIFSTLRVAALIQQTGGGNGFSFSRLRPKGSTVGSSVGAASGPIGFLQVYDAAFGEIAQGGVRRGANMGVLNVNHPDIMDFIRCKAEEGKLANFNISVAITDEFMNAVKTDGMFNLVSPHNGKVVKTMKAREIFEEIIKYAHRNGEPGLLFIDKANKDNPVPHMYKLEATNPCGEQWLGPYENCCLGSINLSEHVTPEGHIDWDLYKESIEVSTRFLDNVVTANKYVPAIPQLREAAENARRIGLGYMGLADLMYKVGVRYGSPEGQELAAQLTEFMRFHSMRTSIELSKERGPFKKIEGSIYDPKNLTWTPPKPLKTFTRDYGRPDLNWKEIVEGIKEHGIRNAAQATVAPTGTISTVAGIEGYGCEPVFALAYYRNVIQAAGNEGKLTLTYISPTFEAALDDLQLDENVKKGIIEKVLYTGSCQSIEELPAHVRDVFVVSADITPDEHVYMQASVQAFIDNSISKTCNFPAGATTDDVAKAYMSAWELGCKGLTVYVTGSRDVVTLETKETKDSKAGKAEIALPIERGYKLIGTTYKIATPQGSAFVTINKNDSGEPLELFINVGKAGSDLTAMAEAIGRITSGWLRSSHDPLTTAKEIIAQLVGIGGSRSVGYGPNRISSVPDAIARVLADEYGVSIRNNGHNIVEKKNPEISVFSYVNMCPECGNASLVQEEGCSKCYNCGYSVC
ncbi:adenosylcobalamin-dependent ribonucleoside-diphosphate reductase [Patescibacteria group bacterium]|nr:adenosylcobalamin-dependent ribonucleoside-diphosphate reductase [Patescibacteria group bacterium]